MSQHKGKMFFDIKKAVAFFNIFFFIIFLIHICSIGYHILYPEVPEIVVYKRNLREVDFPMTFRLCVHELNDTRSRYQRFGYRHYGDFFRGRSMYNDSVYGWAGHSKNGSVLGNVEGTYNVELTRRSILSSVCPMK